MIKEISRFRLGNRFHLLTQTPI